MKKTFPIASMYQRSLELEAAQRGGWLFGSAQATAALDHMRFSFGFGGNWEASGEIKVHVSLTVSSFTFQAL